MYDMCFDAACGGGLLEEVRGADWAGVRGGRLLRGALLSRGPDGKVQLLPIRPDMEIEVKAIEVQSMDAMGPDEPAAKRAKAKPVDPEQVAEPEPKQSKSKATNITSAAKRASALSSNPIVKVYKAAKESDPVGDRAKRRRPGADADEAEQARRAFDAALQKGAQPVFLGVYASKSDSHTEVDFICELEGYKALLNFAAAFSKWPDEVLACLMREVDAHTCDGTQYLDANHTYVWAEVCTGRGRTKGVGCTQGCQPTYEQWDTLSVQKMAREVAQKENN